MSIPFPNWRHSDESLARSYKACEKLSRPECMIYVPDFGTDYTLFLPIISEVDDGVTYGS